MGIGIDEEQTEEDLGNLRFDNNGQVRALMIIINRIAKMPNWPATPRNILALVEIAKRISLATTEVEFRVAVAELE